MSAYLILKTIHVTTVVITITLFVLRGIWMIFSPRRLEQRWVRIVPHVNDTLLLASALALTAVIHQYPFVNGWLTAKVFGIIVYIGLGSVALGRRRARPQWVRITAWCGALLTIGYVVTVALSHSPWPLPYLLAGA